MKSTGKLNPSIENRDKFTPPKKKEMDTDFASASDSVEWSKAMKATIDRDGRITLGAELQRRLGVRPGDEVLLEQRGAECVIKAVRPGTGLTLEGNVLVHCGTGSSEPTDLLESDRDERYKQLSNGIPR